MKKLEKYARQRDGNGNSQKKVEDRELTFEIFRVLFACHNFL